ncbi:PspA/IM30 family protein [Marinagarivorans algicola]|uniref:PspA/IM30 family protein n=1 Tax=Marinagarivorans algicola TaxID=1513270 RepID=UPI0006B637E1|nr:PspA/IM30 family protein [Marinagarivorans algicola]
MGFLRDIVTAVRGGLSEAGEAVVDSQALRILEQEIRDADAAINTAKISLSQLKAKEIGLAKQIHEIDVDIEDYTAKARAALAADKRDLARTIAEKIAELTGSKTDLKEQHDALEAQVNKIYQVIKVREKQKDKNRIELQKAKTYEDLQKTQVAVAAAMPTNDSSAKRVQRALDRVKQKQADTENQMSADQWLNDLEQGNDLDAQIAAAGLDSSKTSADDILAQLEAK